MTTIYTQQSKNIHKTWMIMIVFISTVIGVGYITSQYFNNPFLLYTAVILSILMNAGSFWFSDKLAIKASGAMPIQKQDAPDLWNIVENLSITAGLPMPKLYVINDLAPNAFATGRNEKHSAIAVTTGLTKLLSKRELEAVLAHEMSHIGNKDILVMGVATVLVGFVAIIADILSRSMMFAGDNDSRGGIIPLIIGVFIMLLGPLSAQLMQMAISRKREFLADASGALLTRDPNALADALEKIGQYNQPLKKVNPAIAPLFIANPLSSKNIGKKMAKLFSTHPPMSERIKVLRQMAV